jgi:hypothetical protein
MEAKMLVEPAGFQIIGLDKSEDFVHSKLFEGVVETEPQELPVHPFPPYARQMA